jgi:hypothetical protein
MQGIAAPARRVSAAFEYAATTVACAAGALAIWLASLLAGDLPDAARSLAFVLPLLAGVYVLGRRSRAIYGRAGRPPGLRDHLRHCGGHYVAAGLVLTGLAAAPAQLLPHGPDIGVAAALLLVGAAAIVVDAAVALSLRSGVLSGR